MGAMWLLSLQLANALPRSTAGDQAAFQAAATANEQSASSPRPLVIWSVYASRTHRPY